MLGNKQVMAKNISRLMKENNIDRKKLSNDLKVKYTTLSDWINAKTYPRIDKIELLADYFNVTKADLVEDKEKQVLETLPVKKIPVISKISAGLPIYSEENLIDYIYFATNKLNSDKAEFVQMAIKSIEFDYIIDDGPPTSRKHSLKIKQIIFY